MMGRPRRSTRVLELERDLRKGCNIEKVRQVQMAGQGIALLAVYQNLGPCNSRNVGRERLHQRSHRQFFHQYSGTVAVRESRVEINDGQPGIDQVNVSYLRVRSQQVRGGFIEID